jgi:hypothetical protein
MPVFAKSQRVLASFFLTLVYFVGVPTVVPALSLQVHVKSFLQEVNIMPKRATAAIGANFFIIVVFLKFGQK